MDTYEPASTKASSIGLTLETYILEGMLGRPEARGYFTSLLSSIALAAKMVTSRVRRAGLANVLGYTGETNVQGEQVQKLENGRVNVATPVFDGATVEDVDNALVQWQKENIDSRGIDLGLDEKKPLNDEVEKLPEKPYPAQGGSTDVGDISWHIPTSGVNTACFAAGSPGHSWQNVAAVGSPIGHKGLMVAAKVLALSAVDLLQDPKVLEAGKADLAQRLGKRKYTTRIPEGQKAPKSIR